MAGESALIATENGLSPASSRLSAVLVGGALAGLCGAVLSVDYTQIWANEITKGHGLVAVGWVIVAQWNPRLILPVSLLVGFAETAALRLSAMGVELSSCVLSDCGHSFRSRRTSVSAGCDTAFSAGTVGR